MCGKVKSEGGISMTPTFRDLPVEQRIQLVEDLWDSIAIGQESLPLTAEQRAELDRRLDAYEADGATGRSAEESLVDIRKRL
jgi:putative addiction module component (TIGR02574 family)